MFVTKTAKCYCSGITLTGTLIVRDSLSENRDLTETLLILPLCSRTIDVLGITAGFLHLYDTTKNSSQLFLKVPVNLNVPVKTLHCYAAYLWFKKINRNGILTPDNLPKEYRNRNNYWLKKLVSVGWITRSGDTYFLKSYQDVWRMMGVEKCQKKSGFKGYKYVKFHLDNDKTFLKDVKDGVFRHLVERKKNQIAHKLASGRPQKRSTIRKIGTCVKLSGNGAADMFGYRAFSSGLKVRDKYFKVMKGTERTTFLDHNGVKCWRFECGQVSLK